MKKADCSAKQSPIRRAARHRYDAWGACTIVSDTSTDSIAAVNPYRYRTYYFDSETGLYYLQSRYYDPDTGRFINADDANYVGFNSHNLFAYCGNSPITFFDPSGHCCAPVQRKKPPKKLSIKQAKKQHWLGKLISAFCSVDFEKEISLIDWNLWLIGVKLSMSAFFGASINSGKFFTISSDSVSGSLGCIDISSKGSLTVQSSIDIASTTVKAMVSLTNKALVLGLSLTTSITLEGFKRYFGIKFAISISYVTLGVVAAALVGACLIPAFAPVASAIAAQIGALAANPAGVIVPAVTAIVGGMQAVAA